MKPILFNTEMVRAIQDSTKTVTRRVMKPQPRAIYYDGKVYDDDGLYVVAENQNGGVEQIELPYRPGDILYVRETWQKNPYGIGWPYFYKASPEQFDHAPDKWHPSIHMPREAARIFLKVTQIEVQQVKDITDDEAIAEGFTSRAEFISSFLKMYPDCTDDSWCWVIRFEKLKSRPL